MSMYWRDTSAAWQNQEHKIETAHCQTPCEVWHTPLPDLVTIDAANTTMIACCASQKRSGQDQQSTLRSRRRQVCMSLLNMRRNEFTHRIDIYLIGELASHPLDEQTEGNNCHRLTVEGRQTNHRCFVHMYSLENETGCSLLPCLGSFFDVAMLVNQRIEMPYFQLINYRRAVCC